MKIFVILYQNWPILWDGCKMRVCRSNITHLLTIQRDMGVSAISGKYMVLHRTYFDDKPKELILNSISLKTVESNGIHYQWRHIEHIYSKEKYPEYFI